MTKRRNIHQLERLRAAFWESDDATPAQVPDTYEARATYERESLSFQILDSVHTYMEKEAITQQELAHALDVTEGRVSQILSGEQNLTLKTLASVAAALRAHFDIQLLPAAGTSWERPTGLRRGRDGSPAPLQNDTEEPQRAYMS